MLILKSPARILQSLIIRFYRIRGLMLAPFHRNVVHILHIGKTGGTSIERAVRSFGFQTREYYFVPRSHKVKLRDIPEGDLAIIAIRHPVDRFISAWDSRAVAGGWHSKDERRLHRDLKCEDVAYGVDWYAQYLPHIRDHQHEWFSGPIKCQYFVLRTESLDQHWKGIMQFFGMPPSATLDKENKSKTKSTLSSIDKIMLECYYHKDLKLWQNVKQAPS